MRISKFSWEFLTFHENFWRLVRISDIPSEFLTFQQNFWHSNRISDVSWEWDVRNSDGTHCSTLQHTATRCNTPQHTATDCNTLHQNFWKLIRISDMMPCTAGVRSREHKCCTLHEHTYVAVCCKLLQSVAVCCSVLQCGVTSREHEHYTLHEYTYVAVCCRVWQSVAECCRVLQSVAGYLQWIAVCCC